MGYSFEDWYVNESRIIPYDFSQVVTGGFKLYSKWEKKVYKVNFISTVSNSLIDALCMWLKNIAYNDKAIEPEVEDEKFVLDGWLYDSGEDLTLINP